MLKMLGWKLEENGVILTVAQITPDFKLEFEVKLDVDDYEMLAKHSDEWFTYWNKHGNIPPFNSSKASGEET